MLINKCTTSVTLFFAAEKETKVWKIDMVLSFDRGAKFVSQDACIETGRYVILTTDKGAMGIKAPSQGEMYRIFNK